MSIERLLAGYHRMNVDGLDSIAHLVTASSGRCGIYVLTFRNGDRYVGKTVDVTVRFGAHRRNYPGEIVEIAFRRVPHPRLDQVERDERDRLRLAGQTLRNIVGMPGNIGVSALDEIVTRDRQHQWLGSARDTAGPDATRPDLSIQRHRLQSNYQRLAADPRMAGIADLLYSYTTWTMPFAALTEHAFWALSALPGSRSQAFPRLLTLSVQQLETLWIYAPRNRDFLNISINVDEPTLQAAWGNLDKPPAGHGDFYLRTGDYDTRPDVATLRMHSARVAVRVLKVPGVIEAARRLNLDLMRKGPTSHWRTHNPALADLAFPDDRSQASPGRAAA